MKTEPNEIHDINADIAHQALEEDSSHAAK